MTYHWTDPDGDSITIAPFPTTDGPQITIQIRDFTHGGENIASATVRIPLDRIEELVAGIRDTARQAASTHRKTVP